MKEACDAGLFLFRAVFVIADAVTESFVMKSLWRFILKIVIARARRVPIVDLTFPV